MTGVISWLEAHENLSGWAQFAGGMVALVATYFTAFAPVWHHKRQLRKAAMRLLSHGYEFLESYHRTTPQFLPTSLTLRGAALAVGGIIDEIGRFPIYELADQGSRSPARYLVAVNSQLVSVRLMFDHMAADIGDRVATEEERDLIVEYLAARLELVRKMLAGEVLERPQWVDGVPLAT